LLISNTSARNNRQYTGCAKTHDLWTLFEKEATCLPWKTLKARHSATVEYS